MDKTNLAHKYEDIYQSLNQYENPGLIQSFMLSNNADIIKGLDYFSNKVQNAQGEEKTYYNIIIKRYELLMVKRLFLSEDLLNEKESFDKTEQEEYKDREIKKDEKETKTIVHPASKETVNEKLGKEKQSKKPSSKEIETNKTISKFQKEKEGKSHFEYLFPTEKEQINEFNSYLPKLEILINKNNDYNKARTMLKFIFRSGNPGTSFIEDKHITRIINWIKSGLFTWKSVLEIIKKPKMSISDIVREAEHQAKMEGLTEEQVKDLVKPYFFGKLKEDFLTISVDINNEDEIKQMLTDKELKKLTTLVTSRSIWDKLAEKEQKKRLAILSDQKFNKLFESTLSFIWDKEHKVENEPKKRDRQSVKEELYDLYKNEGAKGVRKMASEFNRILKDMGIDSNLKARISELATFLKQKNPELLALYNQHKKSEDKSTKSTTLEQKPIKEPVEVETLKVDKKEVKKGKSSINVDVEKYKKQLSAFKKLQNIKEYLITLLNKRPNELSEIKDENELESIVYKIAKDRILTLGVAGECDDWTEQDVSQFMSSEVIPYTKDFYKMLSVNSDDEFKEVYRFYIEKFPEGKEKERLSQLEDIITSPNPKTKYIGAMGKKLKKKHHYVLKQISDFTDELYKETK